ncbi:MAG: energy transducer TonB [Betaproteobacteria bacterium]|nr:energy transducer TonB [Betaproteobacteria bacterium]MDE2055948.1 energy transducer TonB [Betaproteobacteria bacterium]
MFDKQTSQTNILAFLIVCLFHAIFIAMLLSQHNKAIVKKQTLSISLFTIPKSVNVVKKNKPPVKQILKQQSVTHKKPINTQTKAIKKEITVPQPTPEKIEPQVPNQVATPTPNSTNTVKRLYIAPSNDNSPPTPKALFNPKPPYPGEAFDNKQEGTVILDVKIAKSGKVLDVKVHQSSHYELLDQSAVESVKLWIFDANSIPKDEWVRIPVNFKIVNR